MATLKKEAEQSNATIAALGTQVEQSSARGLKSLGLNPAACCVHTRVQLGHELWVFVLPHSGSEVAEGDWMRESDFGAAGGSLQNLPQTITETADDEKHLALAKELQPYQRQVAELESALATSKKERMAEVEEHALYKQRAHAVLKKKNDQIELLTSDEGSAQELNAKLISAEAQVEDLEEKLVKMTANLAETCQEKSHLQEQLKSGASARAEVLELRSTCTALETKCETLLEKEKVMLKEMQDAISAEEERSAEKSKALKKEHNEHRTRAKQMMHERDQEIEELRERLRNVGAAPAPAAPAESPVQPGPQEETPVDVEADPSDENVDGLLRAARIQAQRDDELTKFQQKIAEYESKLRSSNQTKLLLTEQVAALKQEIRKAERNKARDSAPMEYLKNIVKEYIKTGNHADLMPVLTMLLQYTPDEVAEIEGARNSRWF